MDDNEIKTMGIRKGLIIDVRDKDNQLIVGGIVENVILFYKVSKEHRIMLDGGITISIKSPFIEMWKGNRNKTSQIGKFPLGTTYKDLVKVFGQPRITGDNDNKSDVEWIGTIEGLTFTIYNWKDGQRWKRDAGTPVEDITDWNIGGHSLGSEITVHEALIQYFQDKMEEE